MALEQLQVAPNIVVAAFSIIFGGIVIALAIAFGVGGIRLPAGSSKRVRLKKKKKRTIYSICSNREINFTQNDTLFRCGAACTRIRAAVNRIRSIKIIYLLL